MNLSRTLDRYGAIGSLRLVVDKVFTPLALRGARLVRRPYYIRGKKWMKVGPRLTTGPGLRLDAFPINGNEGAILRIGHDVELNDYVHIAAVHSIDIGDRVLIASKVFVSDHNHGRYGGREEVQDNPLTPPAGRVLSHSPVIIEDDVWLGEGTAVLSGVRIGRGAVIGANSVVTRDVPEYTIAVGSPARVVKRFNFETSAWERV